MVLDALSGPPFEPLLQVLSLKKALLLAFALAKRVSDIHALSVNPACIRFLVDLVVFNQAMPYRHIEHYILLPSHHRSTNACMRLCGEYGWF